MSVTWRLRYEPGRGPPDDPPHAATGGVGVRWPILASLARSKRRAGQRGAGRRAGRPHGDVAGRLSLTAGRTAHVNVGIAVPLPAYFVDVGFMARRAEELGFESFWCAEHPFIPVSTTSRFPGSADGVIPESYSHFIDPFVALARASGATSRISSAPGSCSCPSGTRCSSRRRCRRSTCSAAAASPSASAPGWLREETELMGGDFDHRWSQCASRCWR